MKLKKSILLAGVFCALGGAMSACNTLDGAGQDIENAGEAVQDAAD